MFWDSSALVSALLNDGRSGELIDAFDRDATPAIWWMTPVECRSAVVRALREKRTSREDATEAMDRLREARSQAHEILPVESVRTRAVRVLAQHPLRAADALQLAAALVWCEEQPSSETFVCLDRRLREAAGREGFTLFPATDAP
jgi:predicted nucleic acid-binding protein